MSYPIYVISTFNMTSNKMQMIRWENSKTLARGVNMPDNNARFKDEVNASSKNDSKFSCEQNLLIEKGKCDYWIEQERYMTIKNDVRTGKGLTLLDKAFFINVPIQFKWFFHQIKIDANKISFEKHRWHIQMIWHRIWLSLDDKAGSIVVLYWCHCHPCKRT